MKQFTEAEQLILNANTSDLTLEQKQIRIKLLARKRMAAYRARISENKDSKETYLKNNAQYMANYRKDIGLKILENKKTNEKDEDNKSKISEQIEKLKSKRD